MMEYIIVSDTSVVAVNRSAKDNESGGIVYRDEGELHTIDFETCANNYQAEHNDASRYCIGEMQIWALKQCAEKLKGVIL